MRLGESQLSWAYYPIYERSCSQELKVVTTISHMMSITHLSYLPLGVDILLGFQQRERDIRRKHNENTTTRMFSIISFHIYLFHFTSYYTQNPFVFCLWRNNEPSNPVSLSSNGTKLKAMVSCGRYYNPIITYKLCGWKERIPFIIDTFSLRLLGNRDHHIEHSYGSLFSVYGEKESSILMTWKLVKAQNSNLQFACSLQKKMTNLGL